MPGQDLGAALGPGLAAMKYLPDLHLKPFQVVRHVFQVAAALFRQIPGGILFFSFGLGMLDQIKIHLPPPEQGIRPAF